MTTSEIATVLAWHDALNAKDVETLVQLSSEDIKIGDAHGAAMGVPALTEWAQAFAHTVTVGRMSVHDGAVVAEQTLEDGTVEATAFHVVHDEVTSVFRHDDLPTALAAAELNEKDLVP